MIFGETLDEILEDLSDAGEVISCNFNLASRELILAII